MVLGEIEILFFTVAALFFVLLAVKGKINRRFCVICASVSLAWAGFLVLRYLGYFEDILILGILMGQSIVGVYYLVEQKLQMFRLPFLLTLTFMAYLLLDTSIITVPLIIFISALWILFILIYSYRYRENMGRLVKKIIECCKNW